jgi:hypothetical protein
MAGATLARSMNKESLKPCPACGEQAGELIEDKGARFPFRAQCRACGWSTDAVKLATVAAKLWNETEREKKAKVRRGEL